MVGSSHKITIESLANSGDGVGRIDGRVVFVPDSCPQDELEIKILSDKKTFLKAKINKILKPGPDRVDPHCRFSPRCGGCDWQHISYNRQIEEKFNHFKQTIIKLGKMENPPLSPIIPSPKTLNYRNRIQLHFDKKGFYYTQKRSHKPVYIDRCDIADDRINDQLTELFSKVSRKKNRGKVELAVIGESAESFKVDDKGNSSLGFRQVNDEQNQYLIEKTLSVVRDKKISKVVDLYCGQGNWIKAIHNEFPKIECLGIESNPVNVKRASVFENENLKFLCGKVEDLYEGQEIAPELVIIDPPRSGCSPSVLESIHSKKPKWLVYISCHPATLARDLRFFNEKGWTLEELVPVDMFPMTSHLECWSLLRSDTPSNPAP